MRFRARFCLFYRVCKKVLYAFPILALKLVHSSAFLSGRFFAVVNGRQVRGMFNQILIEHGDIVIKK